MAIPIFFLIFANMETWMDNDYKNGIKLFKDLCKERHINYRKDELQWVTTFNRILSKHNAAYAFWRNASKKSFYNITNCLTYYDLLYDFTLFSWNSTAEGFDYWYGLLTKKIWRECCGCLAEECHININRVEETELKMKKYILRDMHKVWKAI